MVPVPVLVQKYYKPPYFIHTRFILDQDLRPVIVLLHPKYHHFLQFLQDRLNDNYYDIPNLYVLLHRNVIYIDGEPVFQVRGKRNLRLSQDSIENINIEFSEFVYQSIKKVI